MVSNVFTVLHQFAMLQLPLLALNPLLECAFFTATSYMGYRCAKLRQTSQSQSR